MAKFDDAIVNDEIHVNSVTTWSIPSSDYSLLTVNRYQVSRWRYCKATHLNPTSTFNHSDSLAGHLTRFKLILASMDQIREDSLLRIGAPSRNPYVPLHQNKGFFSKAFFTDSGLVERRHWRGKYSHGCLEIMTTGI